MNLCISFCVETKKKIRHHYQNHQDRILVDFPYIEYGPQMIVFIEMYLDA